jgi:hypothetical protein
MPSNIYVLRLCLSKKNKKKSSVCVCVRLLSLLATAIAAEMSLRILQAEREREKETFEILRATEIWFRLHVLRRRVRVRQGCARKKATPYIMCGGGGH